MKHFFTAILMTLLSVVVYGQKDTLTLSNNDVLVGTIEKMDRSILTFSTSYDDSDFKIKWREVKTIKSQRQFIISVTDGQRHTSSINSVAGKEKIVEVNMADSRKEYSLADIVFIEPIGKSFFFKTDC